jgi:hypothetical protein
MSHLTDEAGSLPEIVTCFDSISKSGAQQRVVHTINSIPSTVVPSFCLLLSTWCIGLFDGNWVVARRSRGKVPIQCQIDLDGSGSASTLGTVVGYCVVEFINVRVLQ